jgi:hypothetical protein
MHHSLAQVHKAAWLLLLFLCRPASSLELADIPISIGHGHAVVPVVGVNGGYAE